MRIAKENVDVKMEIPGAVIRQRTDFGDATGLGKISCEYFSLSAGVDTTPLFKGLEVRSVADLNMAAATARAEEFGVRAQSVDDLLANKDVDVVINLTIPDAHFAVTKRILEAGKHAYSEKPLVLTLEEGVSCEACHGPGSAYKTNAVMKALYAGTQKGADVGLVDPKKELCVKCHNPESPTYKPFKFEEAVKKIAHPVPKR